MAIPVSAPSDGAIAAEKDSDAELKRRSRYFDLSRDMVCTASFDGYFEQLNAAWTENLGWTEAELRSRPFVAFVHPDDQAATMAETAKLADGAVVIAFVNRYATKSGGWHWLDWNASIDPDEQLIYATARDVTGRRRAEAALIASEARTRQIVETAHDAFVAIDSTGAITDWNSQAASMFGWSRREALGRDLAATVIPERFANAHREGLARYLETGEAAVLGRRIELTGRHRDGREFPVELTISAILGDDGVSFNAFLRDISERRQAQFDIERARDQALQASVLKSNFLANMSHEIRTPMNGVLGMTELLLDTALDARQRQYAETVRASGDALLMIINDILDLSKIEAGRLELETIDFDPGLMVEDVADLFSGPAHAKGLELVTAIGEDVPAGLRGDPGRLRQVLTNLLGNAVKFTSRGHVTVSVTVIGSTQDETVLRLQVDDTGIGIDPDQAARVFEPFAQADSSTTRLYGGTGLGLTITRQLVELMGGRCGVDSQPQVGTSFWFTLPLARALGNVITHPRVADGDLTGIEVLVVDDDATNRDVMAAYLAGWGMNVTVAACGTDGIDRARSAVANQRPLGLILIDMHMPGMNGLELAANLAADPAIPRAVMVLLTSSDDDRDIAPGRLAGVTAHMAKPVRRDRLRQCLAQITSPDRKKGVVTTATAAPAVDTPSRGLVLLAEDNMINQKVATAMLETGGYRVDIVDDGMGAVQAVQTRHYDAVLMDCQMPRMDGYQAAEAIRSGQGSRGRVPIIAMTAAAMQEDKQRCLAAGMDDYLTKPVKQADLLATVARWVAIPGRAGHPSTGRLG